MKSLKKTNYKKRNVAIVLSVLALLLIGLASYALVSHDTAKRAAQTTTNTPKSTINTQPATTSEIDTANATKAANADSAAAASSSSNTPSATPSTITIQSMNANENASNDVVKLGVIISTEIDTGTCSLKVTNGTNSKTYSANVQFVSSYSTCTGYSIPVSDLGTGTWTMALTVTSGSSTGSDSTQEVVN